MSEDLPELIWRAKLLLRHHHAHMLLRHHTSLRPLLRLWLLRYHLHDVVASSAAAHAAIPTAIALVVSMAVLPAVAGIQSDHLNLHHGHHFRGHCLGRLVVPAVCYDCVGAGCVHGCFASGCWYTVRPP